MVHTLSPTDRYIILRQGLPVYTTNDCDTLIGYLWGRDLRDQYVVLDYERPYPVDTTDLSAWIIPLQNTR